MNGLISSLRCYFMLCYAVLYYAALCYAVQSYAMLCCAMLCYAMLCYAMLRFTMLRYAMLRYVMLCYVMLCYVMLCYPMLCYVMLCIFCDLRADDLPGEEVRTALESVEEQWRGCRPLLEELKARFRLQERISAHSARLQALSLAMAGPEEWLRTEGKAAPEEADLEALNNACEVTTPPPGHLPPPHDFISRTRFLRYNTHGKFDTSLIKFLCLMASHYL